MADGNGALQTGWKRVGGYWYWMDPTTDAMQTGIRMIDGTPYLLTSSGSMAVGWGIDPETGRWCLADGSGELQTGWKRLGSGWYLMDSDYRMLTGLQTVDGHAYYLNPSGNMAVDWVQDASGSWYLTNGSGELLTGWRNLGGTWYWLDPTTYVMATGVTDTGDGTYYLTDSGAMARSTWVTHDGADLWFSEGGELEATLKDDVITYADPAHSPASGFVTLGGRTYYVDPQTGRISRGTIEVDGTEHVLDPTTDQAVTGWSKDDEGRWIYLDSTGARKHGWVTSAGKWYWMDGQGVMKTGWLMSAGYWYWLNDSGAMTTGWQMVDGTWYYLNGAGVMQTGWLNDSGTWYWLHTSSASLGAMATGWKSINGTWYDLGGSGAWVTTHYHYIEWAGQPNNYYCGPTSGFMILRNIGAWTSASGTSLSIYNVAQYMDTDAYGYTSFQDRWFMRGMNAWLGQDIYTSVHTPSYETVRNAVMTSFINGYATALDEQERRGGPHFNGHNNGTFAHIMVVDGYDENSDAVYIADPGAPTLWPSGSGHFWYWSLRDFVETYMQTELSGSIERIGVHFAK